MKRTGMICWLLCVVLLVPMAAVSEQAGITVLSSHNMEEVSRAFTAQSGIAVNSVPFQTDIMEQLAQAFVTKSSEVDILSFPAHYGLHNLKRTGFFTPLNGSAVIRQAVGNLYPGLAAALTMPDGTIVGWIANVQPLVRLEDRNVLDQLDIPSPDTFEAFLDACAQLMQADGMGSDFVLADAVSYTQQSMLDWYMGLYIMAYQQLGKKVDFSNPRFLRTVERIRSQLPKEAVSEAGMEAEEGLATPVFQMISVLEAIQQDMKLLPMVLDGQAGVVETYATVLVVNPHSRRQADAIRFLEYLSQRKDLNSYFYDTTMTMPLENEQVLQELQAARKEADAIMGAKEATQEQADRLAQLQTVITMLESRRFLVSQQDIEHYSNLAQTLYLSEASPVKYDEGLRRLTARFLAGQMDAQGFADACQQTMALIYMEEGNN